MDADSRRQSSRYARLFADVESLLKQLDETELDEDIGVGTLLYVQWSEDEDDSIS